MATGLTLPFITLSGIARGYFFGKQKMLPHITSNIIEQIVRLLATFIFIPKLLEHSVIYAVTGLVLINIISELASIFILFLFLPNKITIKKEYFKFEYDNFKNIAKISIPNTLSRLISSIGMFLEPIIITFVLTYIGYKNNYITTEYGTISGYVIPMVTLPSFLSGAISSALLPVLTRYKVLNDKNNLKKKLLQGILFSLLIGIPFTIILFFFPKLSLKLIFKTTTGANYLKLAAPLFLISYIAAPLNTCLQAIDKSNTIMFTTIISILVKTILLITLTFLNIGMIPIIISTFVASLLSTIYQIRVIKKYLKDKYKEI